MDDLAPGIEELNNLQQAGFSASEIDQWKTETAGQLQDAGFNSKEVDDYFGVKEPDLSKTKEMFETNLKARLAPEPSGTPAPTDTPPPTPVEGEVSAVGADVGKPKPPLKEAHTFLEAVEAGFDMSVSGLMRQRPDMVLPKDAPMFYRIASQVSQLAGDVPAMVAGGIAGGAAGTAAGGAVGTVALPIVGTVGGAAAGGVMGTGAGAFALPEAMRTVMMEHYEKGDVKDFGDFWERTSAVAINSLKAGTVGALTAGVGGKVAAIAGEVAAPVVVKTAAQLTAEVATMTTVGAALEGKVPEPHDFIDAAILVGGLHGAGYAAGKMRGMYAKGNVTPVEIAQAAQQNPKLKQEILASNVETPSGGEFPITVEKPKPPEQFQTVKPLREQNPNLSPEVNTILGKVGEQTEKTKKSLVPTTSELYTAFVDRLDPINEATKALTNAKELPAEKNPYVLARTAVDYKAKAKHMFENGTLDFHTLEKNGDSLKSVLKSVESVETLEAYMISKRVVEKNGQGVQTGFDVSAAEKVVAEHGAKYEAAAAKVTEFSNKVLDYVSQSGIISADQVARMKEANKDYVPFKRIMDADKTEGGKTAGKAGSLKEFKGSDRAIQSPILAIVENTVELTKMAETNRPKLALVDLAEKTEGQELIRKLKTPVEEITISKEQVAKQLGISVDAAEAVSQFRAVRKELAPDQFAVYKDGKRQIYETTPELAAAIKKLDGDGTSTNLLFKLMHGVTAVKKFGITFTPDFIVKNFIRDSLTASTFSKSKGLNPFDVVSAMGDIMKKNDNYYEWLKSGGANGAFIEMGDRYVKTDIYKLAKETGLMGSVRNLIEKPVEVMRVAAELSEQSIRVAEFKKVRKAGGGLIEGGYASREITVDFQRVGAKVSALNSITAFMNVSIQGLDRTGRAFKEDPAAIATKAMAYITVPSVLLWWANHDDPRYQEIPRWEKDLFWIIPTDNWVDAQAQEADGLPEYMVREKDGKYQVNKGHIYRLPKPQELGIIFGSLPERTLEAYFDKNPKAYKDFKDTVGGIVTPSFVPDAIAPATEQYFNKSFFTGRDIVPQHLREVLPEYQYVDYTSETAKTLGRMVAPIDHAVFGTPKSGDGARMSSPMVLDNYIRSWGGSLGQYAVQLADKALVKAGVSEDKVSPSATLSDLPFIKSFVVRFPNAGSNSVQDFQDNYRENKVVLDTIRHLAKEGDFDNMEKELLLNSNQDKLVQLDGINEALSTQSKFIRLVHKNPDMTPDEKRQMIDGAYLMMTETAKQGNDLMTEIKKQLGD
jgi:hypothetical protein